MADPVKQRKGRASRRRGADRERAVRDVYRTGGWIAIKVSDSSICDVVAIRQFQHEFPYNSDIGVRMAEVLFIEVKGGAEDSGPWAHFGLTERATLAAAANQAGATPILFWWPKGRAIGDAEILEADKWPKIRRKENRG